MDEIEEVVTRELRLMRRLEMLPKESAASRLSYVGPIRHEGVSVPYVKDASSKEISKPGTSNYDASISTL